MPALLEPIVIGKWNGHSMWLQWNQVEAPDGYRVEFLRPAPNAGEDRWKLLDAGRTRKNWRVVPMWCEGQVVMVRVRVNGAFTEPEIAMEAVFRKCTCVFAVQAGPQPISYGKGTMFHAQVDSAACGYQLLEDLEIEPLQVARATVVSLISSGFAQLDHEAHFDLRPGNGVRIWNVEPSENDLEMTGRNYTVLERLPMDGPMTLVRKQPHNPVVR